MDLSLRLISGTKSKHTKPMRRTKRSEGHNNNNKKKKNKNNNNNNNKNNLTYS